MAKLYAAYIARASQTLRGKKVFELSTPFRIQSFKFIHFVLSGTMLTLLWSFLVLMGRKANGQDFFLRKTIGFDFLLFNYMLLSA